LTSMWIAWLDRSMSASSINLAVIPGDGIGPEVIAEAVKVLEKAVAAEGVALELTNYKLGAQHWLETGETLPDEVLADLRTRDAILFGAVGAAPGRYPHPLRHH
jgi:3-isopropylmalate dehydrogenase